MKYSPATSTLVTLKTFDAYGNLFPISNNGQMIFALMTNGVTELWKSDGTTGGTVKFTTLPDEGTVTYRSQDGSYSYFVEETTDFKHICGEPMVPKPEQFSLNPATPTLPIFTRTCMPLAMTCTSIMD
ncbi:MAG: hypothetical protein WDO15_25695 [Bacteroidota bacterium]